jgi:hypothetical protein
MAVTVVLVGIFGVLAGWHWKLMHESWRDLRSAMAQAKGKIPVLKAARSHHSGMAFWYAVAAILIIAFIAKLR